jgi:outer membrane protein assembly factor BamB
MQDNDFSPDTIDAQTARDAASLSAEDARLVRDLRRLHQSAAASNAASMARVQERLRREQEQRTLAAKNDFKRPLAQLSSPLTYIEEHRMSTNEPTTRSAQVWRRLSVIAASLLLVVLVGSMAAVFALAHQGKHPTSASRPTTSTIGTSPTLPPDLAPSAGVYIISELDWYNEQVSKLDPQTHDPLWTQVIGQAESSVVVYGTTLYVSAGDADYTKHDNYIYALDANTGTVLWHVLVDHDAPGNMDLGMLNTPTVTSGTLYVQARDGKLFALDAATGKQLWVYQAPAQATADGTIYNVNTLVVHQGLIYGSLHDVLFAVDAGTGKQRWLQKIDSSQFFNAPQLSNGALYLSSYEESNHSNPDIETGYVYAYTTSGKQQWKRPIGHWVLTDPIVANGLLYFTSYDGQFHALKASDGSEAWHFTLPGPTWDDAMLSDGVLYIDASWQSGSDAQGHPTVSTTFFALEPSSGKELWHKDIAGTSYLDTVQDGVIYLGNMPGMLYAWSAKDGSQLWSHHYGSKLIDKMGEEAESAPTVTVVG